LKLVGEAGLVGVSIVGGIATGGISTAAELGLAAGTEGAGFVLGHSWSHCPTNLGNKNPSSGARSL